MPGGRAKKGCHRMDAAIDHFTPMGYAKTHVRSVVNELLRLYGDKGWPFLEEDCYRVVQDKLFEKEEEQQLMLQQQAEVEEDDEATQQLETATAQAPMEQDMPILKVHEVPAAAVSEVEEEDSLAVDLPAPEPVRPLPPAVPTRPPCYGWLDSSSDSDSDREQSHHVAKILSAGEFPCRRNRPSM